MSDTTEAAKSQSIFAEWQNSDCPDLNELSSAMLRARDGSERDVHTAFMVNTMAWLMGLENRVRALEGREAIRIQSPDGEAPR
jgi:hypothetical protein